MLVPAHLDSSRLHEVIVLLHTYVAGCRASVGHAALLPVQNSGASQGAVLLRQTPVLNLFGGHTVLFPEQYDDCSQISVLLSQLKEVGANLHEALQHGAEPLIAG